MESTAAKPVRSPLPDIGDLLFIGILGLIIFLAPTFLFADGSTGWHLATGHYIIDHGQIPHTDLISYTFPNRLWVPYEWLWDVMAAGLERLGGLNLVALACGTVIAGLFARLYYDMRQEGLHFAAASILTLIGSLVASIHWLARPLLVTWLGVYVFNRMLVKYERKGCSAQQLWIALAVTMIIWVNCHPAFLTGFAIIIIYLGCAILRAVVEADKTARVTHWSAVRSLCVALLLVSLCSLLNPNGLQLFVYISHYLQQGSIIEVTDEFNSPVFHGALYASALELLFFAVAFGLATSSRRPLFGQLITVLAFGHLALNAKRNDPLFAILALPFIGYLLAQSSVMLWLGSQTCTTTADSGRQPPMDLLLPLRRIWYSVGKTTDEIESSCNMHLLPIVTMALLTACSISSHASVTVTPIVQNGFDPLDMPTSTLLALKERHLDPNHGFNLDNWGGYIRYKTGNRVFIDDRSDFYGQEFFQKYGRIAEVREGWDKLLNESEIQWILFPRNSYLSRALLEQEKNGRASFFKAAEDPAAFLFIRKGRCDSEKP